MSKDDTHIARDKPRGHKIEALCGAKAEPDGNMVCGPKNMSTCWKCITLQCGRPVPTPPPTPEHDRLKAAKSGRDSTQLVGEFLEFLGEEGIILTRYCTNGDDMYPVNEKRQLLAKFFEINDNALESEKRALLDYVREMDKVQTWAKTDGRKVLRGASGDT